jgi:hypothetical protein
MGLQRILREETATTELAARLFLLVYNLWDVVRALYRAAQTSLSSVIDIGSAKLHARR